MILIDDRAGSKSLISLPPLNLCTEPSCCKPFRYIKVKGVDTWLCSSNDPSHSSLASLCRLDSADIAFCGNGPAGPTLIGIELKSIPDLISSSSTGRLQATQLPAMLDTYTHSYLLYYGSYKPGPNGELLLERGGKNKWKIWRQAGNTGKVIPFSYLESFLFTVTALGINIKHCQSLEESALWISLLYRWWQKPWSKHRGLRTFDRSRCLSLLPGLDSKTDLCARIAKELPGIGNEKAITIARHFKGSARTMINASQKSWQEVEGVGKTIARAIDEGVK